MVTFNNPLSCVDESLETPKSDHKMSPKSSLEERLYKSAVDCMQKMCMDNERRLKGYLQNPTLLNKGVFYANEYFEALSNLSQQDLPEQVKSPIVIRLKKMINSGAFYHGYASPRYFRLEENSSTVTGKELMKYFLKDNIKPSEALEAIVNGTELFFLDCFISCQIAYFKAILNELGAEKFDALFAADSSTPFALGMNHIVDLLIMFITDRKPNSKQPIIKGESVYIKGPYIYPAKHINGEGASWNVLCLTVKKSQETFIGLGLNSDGVSHSEIEETFVKEFNAKPIGFKGMSKEHADKLIKTYNPALILQAKKIEDLQITLDESRAHGGGKTVYVRSLNKERIKQLADASIEEGLKLLKTWKLTIPKTIKM